MGVKGEFHKVESYDGTRIACASWNNSGSPAIVFSNGICCSDTYWTYLQPYLVDLGYRVVFFDYRGHARSGPPVNPNEVTVPAHARDLWQVADALGVERAILIGHSMGVQTIFEAYRQGRDRVSALIALAGPFEFPLDHLYLTPLGAILLDLFEFTWRYSPTVVRAVWQLSGADTRVMVALAKAIMAVSHQAPHELMSEYFTGVSRLDPLLVVKFFRGMQMHSARDMLPSVTVPVLQIAGGRDMLTPLPLQREMASMLPDVRFKIFGKASHTLPIDEPERCHDEIKQFLRDNGLAPAA